jgi:hypothetical protein
MSADGSTDGTRVELYARSSLPTVATRRRDEIAGRLKELAETEHVSQVAIHNWQKKVPLAKSSRELELHETFETWAEEVGVSLGPFFETRECYAMDTGEKGERLVMPALCLAVYREDRLQSVYPHSTNDGARTVMDCLNAIETTPRSNVFEGSDDGEETDDAVLEATH